MTTLLEKSYKRLAGLPPADQDAIADALLLVAEGLDRPDSPASRDNESDWETLTDSAQSQAALEAMARKALQEEAEGKTEDLNLTRLIK